MEMDRTLCASPQQGMEVFPDCTESLIVFQKHFINFR